MKTPWIIRRLGCVFRGHNYEKMDYEKWSWYEYYYPMEECTRCGKEIIDRKCNVKKG